MILTGYDSYFAAIGDLGVPSKLEYTTRWGASFYVCRQPAPSDRPWSWNKILLIRNNLPYYDWIWWLDADSVITNMKVSVDDLLEKDLVIASDQNGLNAGSLLVRNCDWSFKFLYEVWSQTDLLGHPWFEQAAIHRLLTPDKMRDHVNHIDARRFNSYTTNWKPGDLVIHFPGHPNREQCMLDYVERIVR